MKTQPAKTKRKPRRFPWILLLVFLASVYGFWVLPYQLGSRPVSVEFRNTP